SLPPPRLYHKTLARIGQGMHDTGTRKRAAVPRQESGRPHLPRRRGCCHAPEAKPARAAAPALRRATMPDTPTRIRFHHVDQLGRRDVERAESIVARDGWFPAPAPDLPAGAPPEAVRAFLRRSWRTDDGLARALLCRAPDGLLYLGDYTYAAAWPGGRPIRRRLFAAGRRPGRRADR